MKIFCLSCREYVLKTSDKFVIGGPYDGSMFGAVHLDQWAATMFRTVADVKGGDLFCPRCMGPFLGMAGEILTEHGIVYAGQETLDTSFNIVHGDDMGEVAGMLMYVKDSKPAATEPGKEPVIHDPMVPPGIGQDKVVYSDEVSEGEVWGLNTENIKVVEKEEPALLVCPNCEKSYRDNNHGQYWYDEHIKKCEG